VQESVLEGETWSQDWSRLRASFWEGLVNAGEHGWAVILATALGETGAVAALPDPA